MIVTIVGAGNAGYSHACHLVRNGHNVRLLKTSYAMHEESFKKVLAKGGIFCIDDAISEKRYFAEVDMVTRDENKAIPGADVVFVLTQSLQHENISKRIAPLFENNQMVIIVPGYMGSIYFKRHCRKEGVIFAEGESTAIDARIIEDGVVKILFRNVRNALSFLPARNKMLGVQIAGQLFDTYQYTRKHIIESALHNPNLIVHTIGTIMSANRIEYSNGEFWMYKEAFTRSIWNLINDLDKEKNNILELLGCDRLNYLDACKFRNEIDLTKDSLEIFRSYSNSGPKGPESLNTRYIYEDVPMGLVLMNSIGRKFNVKTPICNSLINIANSLLQSNFYKEGRTLERLGLEHMTRDELIEYVTE